MAPRESCANSMTKRETAPVCDLQGLSVLVTRPAHQADPLCELIERHRGRPLRFPTIEILGPADKTRARQDLLAAADADLLVFVSANAVQYAYPLLPAQLPIDIAIAAVGSSTARALREVGLDATLVPARMDSEGLLALPALQRIDGRSVCILRGNGGRELLAETLGARGARVRQVEVYRRTLPDRAAAARNLVEGWERLVDVVTATSNVTLDNLIRMLGEQGTERLHRTPLVVISRRMAEHARSLDFDAIYVAASARDSDLLDTLCEVNEDVT